MPLFSVYVRVLMICGWVDQSESLKSSLDLVLGLVPKLKTIHEVLQAAEPVRTRSRRVSLSRLETVHIKVMDLQKELESFPVSPHVIPSLLRNAVRSHTVSCSWTMRPDVFLHMWQLAWKQCN